MEKEPLEKERLKMKMLEMEGIRMGAGRSRRIEMGTQENTLVWEDTTYRIKEERVGVETDIWRWGTCLQSSGMQHAMSSNFWRCRSGGRRRERMVWNSYCSADNEERRG